VAVRFNGVTTSSYSATTGIPAGDFTMMCWVQIVADRNNFSTICSIENAAASASSYLIIETGNDGTTANCYVTGSTIIGSIAMTVGTWYKVAASASGATTAFYGAAAGSAMTSLGTGGSGTFTRAQLYMGRNSFGEPLNGRIANYKLYQRALTLAEVENELAQYVPASVTNLQRWHPLLQAETVDYSGNGNALTADAGTITTEDGPPIPWSSTRPRLVVPPPIPPPPPDPLRVPVQIIQVP
jgi:hypothetical protein